MYVRKLDERELTFVVSGKLWDRSLVMQDLETKSLWSHLLGKAMDGELKDKQLIVIPSLLTDWSTWKKKHSDTTAVLMTRTAEGFKRNMYKFNLSRYLVGMTTADESRAWRFEDLEHNPVVNDSFGADSVVVYFNVNTSTAIIFNRQLGQQVLTFVERDGKILDEETESVWDLTRGVAVEGDLKGTSLLQLPAIPSFTLAWRNFYLNTTYWEPSEAAASN